MNNQPLFIATLGLLLFFIAGAVGCQSGSHSEVVVYSALDREFSEPILNEFTRQTGIAVRAKYDVESTKTVGLTEEIIAESDRPRCDLFWNNEILNTLRLEKRGLLDSYKSPAASDFPSIYRSPSGTWHGFAARVRVILVNTKLVPPADRPKSIRDLADPRWRGKTGIAKPLFGTTATHAACLFAAWGDEHAKEFFRSLKQNDVQIMSGNKQVARAVASGQLAFGLTDTDDAIIEVEQGMPVEIIYPDQQADGIGTLFIPNTLALIKGSPNGANARRIVDYLLSPQVEEKLGAGPSAQIPLNPAVKVFPRVKTPSALKPMHVEFSAAGERCDAAAKFIRDEFARN